VSDSATAAPSRWDSWQAAEDGDAAGRDRDRDIKGQGLSLMSKLKALASSGGGAGHARSRSTVSIPDGQGSLSVPQSPIVERFSSGPTFSRVEEEGSDADAEQTADEGTRGVAQKKKKRRKSRRPYGASTAPTTPRRTQQSTDSPGDTPRASYHMNFLPLRRRNTLTEGMEERSGGVSEGEGRDRLGMGAAWRRGSSWIGGVRSHNTDESPLGDAETPARRPFIRRLTTLGGSDNEVAGAGSTPRRPFLGFERATNAGMAARNRWNAVRHGLKFLNQKKEVPLIDYHKSAELMAELRAGAPAALMLASMLQRDEHGNKRIPVLLEQLKLKITDSRTIDGKDDEMERHQDFRIDLEYGSGDNPMKWTIYRTLQNFLSLHIRYKLQASTDKYLQLRDVDHRPKQPKFPRSAFPYLKNFRGLDLSDEEEEAEGTAPEATVSEADLPGTATGRLGMHGRKKSRAANRPGNNHRRKSSAVFGGLGGKPDMAGMTPEEWANARKEERKVYNERQRRKLEEYLTAMIRWLIFRADSNRLCKFLEVSALGVRLAAEGSYHGKEGHLVIGSTKGIDFRKILTPANVFQRHKPKWFLVRSSYVVAVDSPETMRVYDVYLVDSKFDIQTKEKGLKRKVKDTSALDIAMRAKTKATYPQHHRLKLKNSERKIDLLAKNERILKQFEDSIRFMMENSVWTRPNRFGSFAPVRQGCFAQWLVDGRDYMWNVSRAINMAKDVIYIHDWWLSPQLYLRRPAAISQKWRLDRLLKQKAKEGVKIFIIVYRNVEAAVPIDSEFTKLSMLDLHPNIFLQRSPNQFKKNQFFFAHHEKLCVVDHTIAFIGGIDLCFGRWDTPQHSVVDDKPTGFEDGDGVPKDADHIQLWPGKDYSNPRVQDFYELNKPYIDMYEREKTPRMPWHDISMMVTGQPARDLTRHFVQRWNYVLRGRKPTRPTPFLLPPPDFKQSELDQFGLNGTCEVQMLRSACSWSLGISDPEHSIMNAYCKMIEESEHFVYLENQFFITSTETMGVKIVNKIGDAIVERAVRAYKNAENWRCVVLIPLMPGFQNTVDAPDGSSVRLIMQCQFRSISRGEGSIFQRLRNEGIDPTDYVSFYSLRSWGEIGPSKAFVTEQLYIHAKVIIVDDRIALIGSANINERSQLGTRDSETAAVVRDTDMIWSTMGGEPYLVGRFAHTLRMRLMREHLGVDVDGIMEEERRLQRLREEQEEAEYEEKMGRAEANGLDHDTVDSGEETPVRPTSRRSEKSTRSDHPSPRSLRPEHLAREGRPRSFNIDADFEGRRKRKESRLIQTISRSRNASRNNSPDRLPEYHKNMVDVEGEGPDRMKDAERTGLVRGRDSIVVNGREVLVTHIAPEGKGTLERPKKPKIRVSPVGSRDAEDSSGGEGVEIIPPTPIMQRLSTAELGLPFPSQLPSLPIVDDTDIGGPAASKSSISPHFLETEWNPLTADITPAAISESCMKDPLNDTFFDDVWTRVAENNTKIFRRVFRCMPDDEVTNWHEYTEYQAYAERYAEAQMGAKSTERQGQEAQGKTGPPGAGSAFPRLGVVGDGITNLMEKVASNGSKGDEQHPEGGIKEWADRADRRNESKKDTTQSHDAAFNEKQASVEDEKGRGRGESPVTPALGNGIGSLNEKLSEKPTTTQPSPPRTTLSPTPGQLTAPTASDHASATPSTTAPLTNKNSVRYGTGRRRRGTTKSRKGFSASDDLLTREEARGLLDLVQGNLVVFPTEWLKAEEHNSNWLYQVDQVAPLSI
jgi:phospholipase D1/2